LRKETEEGNSRVSRRSLLKTAAAAASGIFLASTLPTNALIPSQKPEEKPRTYYQPYILTPEEAESYGLLGLVVEKDGVKYAANPLSPDKPLTYMKPYKEDSFKLHPPGASEDFYSKCIRCGLCYFACERMGYHAIKLQDLVAGINLIGTPVVDDQEHFPCTLCMECTKVCPTGALREISKDEPRMGAALIDPDLCWGWNSGECISCAKACPAALTVFELHYTEWGTHPYVHPDECRGCGLCVQACPVVGSAIHVLPKEEYERRAKNFKDTGIPYKEYTDSIRKMEVENPGKAAVRSMINARYVEEKRGLILEKIKRA